MQFFFDKEVDDVFQTMIVNGGDCAEYTRGCIDYLRANVCDNFGSPTYKMGYIEAAKDARYIVINEVARLLKGNHVALSKTLPKSNS